MSDSGKKRSIGKIVALLMLTLLIVPALAGDQGPADHGENLREFRENEDHHELFSESRDREKKVECRHKQPDSFTEIPDLTFDSALVESTPHWIFLAAGKKEREALLSYLDRAGVSREKRNEWKHFMNRIWEKYPVRYEKAKTSGRLVLGKEDVRYSLTRRENATFQEIERYIAKDMDMTKSNYLIVQWVKPTHSAMIRQAILKENLIDDYYLLIADSSSKSPDDWYTNNPVPFAHQLNHGYVPLGIQVTVLPIITLPTQIAGAGFAPDNYGRYAQLAKTAFASRDYDGAFTNMGYASHFISDLGNPFHTPNVQILPLQYVDSPFSEIIFPNTKILANYKLLHDQYESYAMDHISEFGSTDESYDPLDPTFSAKGHAVFSWAMSYPLMHQCYWHYIIKGNFDFGSNPVIASITQNRVLETAKHNRGLVHFVMGGKPITYTLSPTAGPGGSISPASPVTISYGQAQKFTIVPATGYTIQDVKVNGVSKGQVSEFTFSPDTLNKARGDQTIEAYFTGGSTQPPNTNFKLTSGFQCQAWSCGYVHTVYTGSFSWNGAGHVYLTGGDEYTKTFADDAFEVTTNTGSLTFFRYNMYYEGIPDITSICRPGNNQLTVKVKDLFGRTVECPETWLYFDNGMSPTMLSGTESAPGVLTLDTGPAMYVNTTETEEVKPGNPAMPEP